MNAGLLLTFSAILVFGVSAVVYILILRIASLETMNAETLQASALDTTATDAMADQQA